MTHRLTFPVAELARQKWRARAACRDDDPELFFPAGTCGPAYDARVREAKAVCAHCPVVSECLTEALARIPYGIAGGLTEHERRELVRERNLAPEVPEPESEPEPVRGQGDRAAGHVTRAAGIALLIEGRLSRGMIATTCGVHRRTVDRWAMRPDVREHIRLPEPVHVISRRQARKICNRGALGRAMPDGIARSTRPRVEVSAVPAPSMAGPCRSCGASAWACFAHGPCCGGCDH